MSGLLHEARRFLTEMKRRKVYRVAVAYIAAVLIGLEALDLLVPTTTLPEWASPLFLGLAVVGFPVAIVFAWVYDLTPDGVRRTEHGTSETGFGNGADETPQAGDVARFGRRSAWVIVALAALVLIGTGSWWYLANRGQRSSEQGETPRQTVAVLPFTTSGADVEELGDGMVNLLSMGLEGAGGIRAIDHRTVLAGWSRRRGGGDIEQAEALRFAHELGAEWAVLGTAVAVGDQTRLIAEVRTAEGGDHLGQVRIEAPQDSLLSAVDALTLEILDLLFERGVEKAPPVPMAGLTTRSLPALKAYLNGEQHYRNGRLESAVAAYGRAVRHDSTFALAHLRQAIAWGWVHMRALPEDALEMAYAHRERLPDRARLVVVGAYLFSRSDPRAVDTLQHATRRFPDDPELWSWLGEAYFHERACRGPEQADDAFARAIEHHPGFAPYWIHPVHLAIGFYRDSVMAAERIEAMHQAEMEPGDGAAVPGQHPGLRLVFGGDPATERAQAFLEDVDRRSINLAGSADHVYTGHPSRWALRDTLLRADLRRSTPSSPGWSRVQLVRNDLRSGRVQQALQDIARFGLPPELALGILARARAEGTPVPDSALKKLLVAVEETEPGNRRELLDRVIAATELDAFELMPDVDAALAGFREGQDAEPEDATNARLLIEAFLRGKEAHYQEALDLVLQIRRNGSAFNISNVWLGDLYRGAGNPEAAVRCYRTAWDETLSYRRLGDLYSDRGQPNRALTAYATVLEGWSHADPALQPAIASARQRLEDLSPVISSDSRH